MKKRRKYRRNKTKRSDKSNITIKNNETPSKKSLIKRVFSLILVGLSLWGIFVTTWVAVTPRIFVYSALPLDPNNPAFTPFVVRNEGYLAIHDVKFSCSMKYLKYPGDILVIGLGDYANSFSDPKQVASVIDAGEQCSELLPLTKMEHNKIENADIAIVLSFKPIAWLPLRCKTLHRFVSTQGKDKQWHWLPQPIRK